MPKKNGAIRLCGNYKTTVNPQLKTVSSPNINIDDILADLAGGVKLSKLDLANAYNQMEFSHESREYLTIATHNGLFRQNRLVFGITRARALWQNAIEKVLQGLPGVNIYLDDILEYLGHVIDVKAHDECNTTNVLNVFNTYRSGE